MTYSYDEMQGFLKESRKNRTTILDKLAHGKGWTIDSFSERVNSRDDLAKAVFDFANDLNKAMKWIEKVHGDHFAAVKELAEARKDNGNEAINAVISLKTAIDEKIVDTAVRLAEATEATGKTLDWNKIEFKKSISDTVSQTVRAERKKERLIEENKNSQRERSCRVVLFGITETDEPEFAYVKKMLYNINADENSLVSVERIGRRPADCQGPDSRPIRATFRDSVSARECLKQAPALKTESYEKVYMSRDLSKKDQLKRRELVKELKAKIASQIDRYWVIKDGKVVDGGERKDRKASEAPIASPTRTRSISRLLELKTTDRK
jgi:hypothetical protein